MPYCHVHHHRDELKPRVCLHTAQTHTRGHTYTHTHTHTHTHKRSHIHTHTHTHTHTPGCSSSETVGPFEGDNSPQFTLPALRGLHQPSEQAHILCEGNCHLFHLTGGIGQEVQHVCSGHLQLPENKYIVSIKSAPNRARSQNKIQWVWDETSAWKLSDLKSITSYAPSGL